MKQNALSQLKENQEIFLNEKFIADKLENKLQGLIILVFTKNYDAQSLREKVQEIAGTNFQVCINKTLLYNAYEIKIKIHEYSKVNGGMFYKSSTFILNKLIEGGIHFISTKHLY